ncbi:PREDICTED: chromatin remodeling protein EBS-like [Camelina sativa]|uniref:Chromatin remodeling protein EBS-like n=1 Tax=Camelina sativa TaxID=90675 RepID=A0ABM0TD73_CAMSA|nr:PREDICTED: chromatin remodeling protein EBS-like [Camelina sativa]
MSDRKAGQGSSSWRQNGARLGDCVHWMLVSGKPPYVARVKKIEADARNNVKVHCRWLENVGAEDYYCSFEYKDATGAFTRDRVAEYCKCEMPYNPNDLIVQCEGCSF